MNEEMPEREEVYVFKKCGYVLPKKDAVVSGWDAESSSTHVHCPRCGRIIARYVKQKRNNRLELDSIDKILFILPFLTLADTVSTQYSLMLGGKEGDFLARPVYEQYGQLGLVALSIFLFFASLGCVWFLRFAKTRIIQGEVSKLDRVALVVAVNFFFLGEAYCNM
ncbi:MAG: hypothetical protein OEY47_04725 [Candidatus Bathyarchaeota archaeon]|nr:hypothetical protein [Candidatus Bathyarchaeota archaeon]MDH5701709.1 hypothetical protein [Candidatus Bathyarchaeota archaeon]